MPLNTLRDLLVTQLHELRAAETRSAEVLPRLARAAHSAPLAAALRGQTAATAEHLARLDRVFDDLGQSPRAAPAESRGMRGLCQDCLRLADMPRAEPHVRDAALIAVAQHVLHDEIAGYGCARTWAQLLGHERAAERLADSLAEERRADAELTRLADTLNRQALAAGAAA